MGRYGDWDEERLGSREDWRERRDEWRGRGGEWGREPRGREDEWRREWRGAEPEERRGGGARDEWEERGRERGAGYGVGYGYGPEERWRAHGGEGREGRRSRIDPPWVEATPERRRRGDTRGLVEWEDRGPIEWLGDKVREMTGERPRGPKGYKRSDERIHDDVCERIARSGVDADEVEVRVEGGEVTLAGTVRSRWEKWRLEEVADDAFGVEEVHNHVRVSRPQPGARADDPSLRH
jgi:hypothetical protein